MVPIRKNDIVTLLDGAQGKVIDIITTEVAKVYKIRIKNSQEIGYFDENKVKLQKSSTLSAFLNRIALWFKFTLTTGVLG
jgi:hypothetical protein